MTIMLADAFSPDTPAETHLLLAASPSPRSCVLAAQDSVLFSTIPACAERRMLVHPAAIDTQWLGLLTTVPPPTTPCMSQRATPPIPSHDDVAIEANDRVWPGLFPLDVVRFRQRRFDGAMSEPHTWELLRRGAAAALVPYDPWSDSVVLIQQFRLGALAAGLEATLDEVPAGLCESGESPDTTIRREVEEETRLQPDRLHRIGNYLLSPGASDETCTLFAGRVHAPAAGADGIAGYAGAAGENEDIRIHVWPAATAIEAAFSGRFSNVITTLGLLWLATKRDWLRQLWMDP